MLEPGQHELNRRVDDARRPLVAEPHHERRNAVEGGDGDDVGELDARPDGAELREGEPSREGKQEHPTIITSVVTRR